MYRLAAIRSGVSDSFRNACTSARNVSNSLVPLILGSPSFERSFEMNANTTDKSNRRRRVTGYFGAELTRSNIKDKVVEIFNKIA